MFYISDLFIAGFTYLFMNAFENAIHKASHYKESGQLYSWHKMHHKDYPAKCLESDTYIDSTGYIDNMFARYIVVTAGTFYIASSSRTFMIIVAEVSVYSFMVDYFNQQFHLKKSWLIKYKWFQRIKRNHLLHHIKQETNFSFFSTKMDKLQNTYLCDSDCLNRVTSNS